MSTDSNDSNESDTRTSPSRLEQIRRKIVNAVKVNHYMAPNYKKPSIESLDDDDYGNDESKIYGTKHVQYQYYNSCCKNDSSRRMDEQLRSSDRSIRATTEKTVRHPSNAQVYKKLSH